MIWAVRIVKVFALRRKTNEKSTVSIWKRYEKQDPNPANRVPKIKIMMPKSTRSWTVMNASFDVRMPIMARISDDNGRDGFVAA
jgi:hypothetical protein